MTDRVFHMDDCVVSLPGGFADRSVNVLEWELERGDNLILSVQRERLLPGLAFADWVDLQTRELPTRFTGFRLERNEEVPMGWGYQVMRKAFRWKRDAEVVYNHQVFVQDRERVLLFTATGKARHREEVDRLVERILTDLKFRED